MALAERTWERVGERKRDRARLIESTGYNISPEFRRLEVWFPFGVKKFSEFA